MTSPGRALGLLASHLHQQITQGQLPVEMVGWVEPGYALRLGDSFRDLGVYVARSEGCGQTFACQGKGRDADTRLISAILESAERKGFTEWTADLVAPFADVARDAIDPRTQGLDFDDDRPPGCARFDADRAVEWSWARSLRTGRRALFHQPRAKPGFWAVTSNGAAASDDFDDAAARGLLELVERDSLLVHWHLRRPARRELLQVGVEYVEWLGEQGFEARVFDITTDLGIPSVLAVAIQRSTDSCVPLGGVLVGAAAGPSFESATASALLEVIQSQEALRAHGGTDAAADVLRPTSCAFHYATTQSEAAFAFLQPETKREPDESTLRFISDGRSDLLGALSDALERAGFEAFVRDGTPPWAARCGVRLAETIVPGLQQLGAGIMPGSRGRRLDNARLRLLAPEVSPTAYNSAPRPL